MNREANSNLVSEIPLEDIVAATVARLYEAGEREAWRIALESYADTKQRVAAKNAERAKINRLPRMGD